MDLHPTSQGPTTLYVPQDGHAYTIKVTNAIIVDGKMAYDGSTLFILDGVRIEIPQEFHLHQWQLVRAFIESIKPNEPTP